MLWNVIGPQNVGTIHVYVYSQFCAEDLMPILPTFIS